LRLNELTNDDGISSYWKVRGRRILAEPPQLPAHPPEGGPGTSKHFKLSRLDGAVKPLKGRHYGNGTILFLNENLAIGISIKLTCANIIIACLPPGVV